MVSLASLVGERMLFDGDSSSGVSGDLQNATRILLAMEGLWGMGGQSGSYAVTPAPHDAHPVADGQDRAGFETTLGRRGQAHKAARPPPPRAPPPKNPPHALAGRPPPPCFKTPTPPEMRPPTQRNAGPP